MEERAVAADLRRGVGTSLLFVLGASRGFGRSFLMQGLDFLKGHPKLHIVLLGLSTEKMEKQRVEVQAAAASGQQLSVDVETLNFEKASDPKAFAGDVRKFLQKHSLKGVGTLLVLSNSGAAEAKYIHSFEPEEIQRMTSINCTSFHIFTTELMRWLVNEVPSLDIPPVVRLVETSSKAGVTPIGALGLYCAHKADRLMFYRCLAGEVRQIPALQRVNFKTLSYGPGPMKTDLTADMVSCEDQTLRGFFRDSSSYVNADDSARALWKVVMKDEYPPGEFVDISDIGRCRFGGAKTGCE